MVEEEDRLSTVQKLSQSPRISVSAERCWRPYRGHGRRQLAGSARRAVNVVLQWPDVTLLASTLVDAMSGGQHRASQCGHRRRDEARGRFCIDPLLTALAPPEHRKVLVDVLERTGTRVIPALGQALSRRRCQRPCGSDGTAASFSSEEAVPALRAALRSPDMLVALAAPSTDGNRQHIVPPVAEVLPLREAVALRPAMMTSLGYSKDAAAVPVPIDGLLDKARGGSRGCAGCSASAVSAAQRRGQKAGDSGNRPSVRMKWRSFVVRALLAGNPPVRQATAALLGWTGRRKCCVRWLALGDADRKRRRNDWPRIPQMGVEAISVLCDMLPTLDPRSRASAFHFFNRHATEITDEGLRGRIRLLFGCGTRGQNAATAAGCRAKHWLRFPRSHRG